MKFVILLVCVVAQISAQEDPGKEKGECFKATKACRKGTTSEEWKEFREKKTSNNVKITGFSKCFLEELKVLDAACQINYEAFISKECKFTVGTTAEQRKEQVEKCKQNLPEDCCEKSTKFVQCYKTISRKAKKPK